MDTAADVFSVAATLIWLFTGGQGDRRSEAQELRDQLASWFASYKLPAAELDMLCEVLSDSIKSEPGDRASVQEIWQQLDRVADTCKDESHATAHLAQTADGPAMTSDFQVAADSAADDAPSESIGNGFRIGRFLIRRKLGEGGMGAVYEAEDPSDGSIVAVKVLSRRVLHRRDAVRRFRKEARLLGEIKSPYVTNLLEVNEDEGVHYIVMEYVSGVDLHQMIRQGAPFEEKVRAVHHRRRITRAGQLP